MALEYEDDKNSMLAIAEKGTSENNNNYSTVKFCYESVLLLS